MLAGERRRKIAHGNALFHFEKNGKSMRVKDRSLHQHQRRHGRAVQQFTQMI
jgi:hypothetical protein